MYRLIFSAFTVIAPPDIDIECGQGIETKRLLSSSQMEIRTANIISRTGLLRQFRALPSTLLQHLERRRVDIDIQKAEEDTRADTQNSHYLGANTHGSFVGGTRDAFCLRFLSLTEPIWKI